MIKAEWTNKDALDLQPTCNQLATAEPKTGECRTCKRSSGYRWSIGENDTRCPIEEHYALPKDGYCHLYEPYREDGE